MKMLIGILFVVFLIYRWVSVSTRHEMENEDSIYW